MDMLEEVRKNPIDYYMWYTLSHKTNKKKQLFTIMRVYFNISFADYESGLFTPWSRLNLQYHNRSAFIYVWNRWLSEQLKIQGTRFKQKHPQYS